MNEFKETDEQVLAIVVFVVIMCCCMVVCLSRNEEIRFPTQDNTDDHLTDLDSNVQLTGNDTDAIETIWE